MLRKTAGILLVVLGWALLLFGAVYAFNGVIAALQPGWLFQEANNPGPGLVLILIGIVLAGIGWLIRWLGRRMRPPASTKGLTRG